MVQLTQDDLDIIRANPLGDSLSAVREALREAELNTPIDVVDSKDSAETTERPRLLATVVGKLVYLLSGSEVALSLASRTGKESLLFDLTVIRLRVQKGDFEYQHFRLLSQLVIKQAPDVDIWDAVITLTRAITQSTPPSSLPPSQSSPDTPITHSLLRSKGGFHEKYFEGHKRNKRAQRIWPKAKRHYNYVDKRWSQLPEGAEEDDVWDWLSGLQGEFLADERCAYYRSIDRNRVGMEANRQLDILVKKKTADETTESKHDWKDVAVVGEVKKPDQKNKALWLQVGSAVRNVFASQPTRWFVHAFTLTGTKMETWVFDRSGPYSGVAFDIHEEPEKFTQVMCGYLMMSDEELGLDTVSKVKDGKVFITLPVEARGRKRKQDVELDPEPIAHQRAIVCRGTACYLARIPGATNNDRVVKYAWTSSKRPPEADLLRKANERGVRGLAKLVGYNEEVTSISKLREGLVFPTRHKFHGVPRSFTSSISQSSLPRIHSFNQVPGLSIASKKRSADRSSQSSKRPRSNSQLANTGRDEVGVAYSVEEPQGTSLLQQDEDEAPFDDRILRILAISPAGRSIRRFQSILELLEGVRDAIKVHQSLLLDGKILHRDISENNIILTDPETPDGFKGVLIDLDLAKEEGKGPSGARHRTGTLEFMAIEVLRGVAHTYRHDLEAALYLIIWLGGRRGWSLTASTERPPEKSMLSRWYTGDYEEIAQSKRGDMDKNGLEIIMNEFPKMFDPLKPLCRRWRDILFPYKDGLFTGTPKDPDVLYQPMLEAINETINSISV